MIIKSNEELSFRKKLDAGWTKEELIKYYSMTEKQYEKVMESLSKIHGKVTGM